MHAADALAVLDHLGIERAWAVGHSWGGHLALHLTVAHPERVFGVVGVSPLGAFRDAFEPMGEALRRPLSEEQRARVDQVEELRKAGLATGEDLRDRWALLWPQYFAHAEHVTGLPARVGSQCSADTNASISEHFERGTLARALPYVSLPVLFVHGADDPLPLSSVERTAALVPEARVHVIADCGHFPWWERPGEIRRSVGEFLAGQPL
jgi:pimeloyl-ACP methyl ester carboxylesterase